MSLRHLHSPRHPPTTHLFSTLSAVHSPPSLLALTPSLWLSTSGHRSNLSSVDLNAAPSRPRDTLEPSSFRLCDFSRLCISTLGLRHRPHRVSPLHCNQAHLVSTSRKLSFASFGCKLLIAIAAPFHDFGFRCSSTPHRRLRQRSLSI